MSNLHRLGELDMREFCIVEKADHIMTVKINRPDRLNALHPPGNAELGEVFDEFASDDDLWVATVSYTHLTLPTRRFV